MMALPFLFQAAIKTQIKTFGHLSFLNNHGTAGVNGCPAS